MSIRLPMPVDSDWDEYEFAAQMTARQFLALQERIDHAAIVSEVAVCRKFKKARIGKKTDRTEVRRWLVNGWNTEKVLSFSEPLVEDAGGATLQWVFPQAYYAAFASTLAFFETTGYTERAHASAQRRFAELCVAGHYPESLRIGMSGTKKSPTSHGLSPASEPSPIYYRPGDPGSVDRKLFQFLKSTREIDLDKKAPEMGFETKARTPLKRLTEPHWVKVAAATGPTGILHLLYRKRIKANYREMDAFLESGFDPLRLFESLRRIVTVIAFVHECLIARALGKKWYADAVEDYDRKIDAPFLLERARVVASTCTT